MQIWRAFRLTVDSRRLTAANMIACAGYRITAKVGHHQVSLEAARVAVGVSGEKLLEYFDTRRRKRNRIDYTQSNVATETEAKEIVAKAAEFYELVEKWIAANHSSLKK